MTVRRKACDHSIPTEYCLVTLYRKTSDNALQGGVNTTRNYAELMGFGHWDAEAGLVKVDKSLLQGGIVGHIFSPPLNT